jgi:hypothetical protein
MTRKDYVRIAAALHAARDTDPRTYGATTEGERNAYAMGLSVAWARCAQTIADSLAEDNPRFDIGRFLDAADPMEGGTQ